MNITQRWILGGVMLYKTHKNKIRRCMTKRLDPCQCEIGSERTRNRLLPVIWVQIHTPTICQ